MNLVGEIFHSAHKMTSARLFKTYDNSLKERSDALLGGDPWMIIKNHKKILHKQHDIV